jgi:hypothetical protein
MTRFIYVITFVIIFGFHSLLFIFSENVRHPFKSKYFWMRKLREVGLLI